jgi:hypothetical protein
MGFMMHVLSYRSADMHQEAGNKKTAQHQAVHISAGDFVSELMFRTSGD